MKCKTCDNILAKGEIEEEPKGICDTCAMTPEKTLEEKSRAALDYLNSKLFN